MIMRMIGEVDLRLIGQVEEEDKVPKQLADINNERQELEDIKENGTG
jgi:hypothetical protein